MVVDSWLWCLNFDRIVERGFSGKKMCMRGRVLMFSRLHYTQDDQLQTRHDRFSVFFFFVAAIETHQIKTIWFSAYMLHKSLEPTWVEGSNGAHLGRCLPSIRCPVDTSAQVVPSPNPWTAHLGTCSSRTCTGQSCNLKLFPSHFIVNLPHPTQVLESCPPEKKRPTECPQMKLQTPSSPISVSSPNYSFHYILELTSPAGEQK